MHYYIHIPTLLEFACNAVCDDITTHGVEYLIINTPIPYPLYLRCITTYADKNDTERYSIYRWYCDVRAGKDVECHLAELYPHVVDHVVLDDTVEISMLCSIVLSLETDDVINAIYRFASRCMACDKRELLVTVMNEALIRCRCESVRDVLIYFGGRLNRHDTYCFIRACMNGMSDVVMELIASGQQVRWYDISNAIISGDCETIKIVKNAYRESYDIAMASLLNATTDTMELLLSLGIIKRGKRCQLEHIPTQHVLQWILDHDVMEHDGIICDVAKSAVQYRGHYSDMLHWLIEQRHLPVPKDILIHMLSDSTSDLLVFDYLVYHGADINAIDRHNNNMMSLLPYFKRYWLDHGIINK